MGEFCTVAIPREARPFKFHSGWPHAASMWWFLMMMMMMMENLNIWRSYRIDRTSAHIQSGLEVREASAHVGSLLDRACKNQAKTGHFFSPHSSRQLYLFRAIRRMGEALSTSQLERFLQGILQKIPTKFSSQTKLWNTYVQTCIVPENVHSSNKAGRQTSPLIASGKKTVTTEKTVPRKFAQHMAEIFKTQVFS